MELYEGKGLIQPERIGSGKMRRFSLHDVYRLASSRLFHNCGFGMNEIVHLLHVNSFSELAAALDRRMHQLNEEIAYQQGILSGMERLKEMAEKIERHNTGWELVPIDGFYRIFIRRLNEAHESDEQQSEELCNWNRFMPITEASLRFPMEDLVSGQDEIHTEIGMIIEKADFEKYNFSQSDRVAYIGPCVAAHGIASCNELKLDSKEWLKDGLAYIERHQLRIAGDGFSRLIYVIPNERQEWMRFDEVWIPIQLRANG